MAWTFTENLVNCGKINENRPGPRSAHSCDIVDSKLYLFGGWNGKKALNDLHVLNTDEFDWELVEVTGRLPVCRNNHTSAVAGRKIYIHGGHDGVQWLDDLHVLDTRSLIWSSPPTSGRAPSARACHTMSRISKKLYLFGGYDGHRCFNSVDVLDLESMNWVQLQVEGSLPQARNAHTMTVVGKKLFLFGGHSGNKHLKDLHVFDTELMTWFEPNVFGPPPKGLRGHTASIVGSKIYLFGGYDGHGRSSDLYILDSETMIWSHSIEAEGLPVGRQRHTACSVNNQYIYFFGGFDGSKWLNDIFILDVAKLEASALVGETINNFIGNLKDLVNNPVFSDISFTVSGQKLYAHRSLLAVQSEHFYKILSSYPQQKSIQITNWSFESFRAMLEFLYTGDIPELTQSLAEELVDLAHIYDLKLLKKLCENCLIHSVHVQNVCDVLVIAYKSSAAELKNFCLNFIAKNFQEVNSTDGFENLERVPSLLVEVTRLIFAKLDC